HQKAKRLLPDRQASACMVGLICYVTLTLAGEIAGISYAHQGDQGKGRAYSVASWLYLFIGMGIGHVVSSLQTHSLRSLGLIPYASLGLAVVLACSVISRDGYLISALLGVASGIAVRSLLGGDTDAIRRKIDARPEILLFVIAGCLIGFVTLGM